MLGLGHLQPRPQQAPPGHFFGAGAKKTAQSRPQDNEKPRFGLFSARRTQAKPGALGVAWGLRRKGKARLAHAVR